MTNKEIYYELFILGDFTPSVRFSDEELDVVDRQEECRHAKMIWQAEDTAEDPLLT